MATSMLRPGGLAVGRRLNLETSNKKQTKTSEALGLSKTWRPMSCKSSEIAKSKTTGFSPQDQSLFLITG